MDDLVKKYLQNKYGENYDQKAQTDYDDSREQNRWAGALTNFGEALGSTVGKSRVGDSDAYFQGLNKQAKENTIGKIEKDRDQYVDNKLKSGQMAEIQRKDNQSNANSNESIAFRKIIESKFPDVAKSYGDSWQNVTAADQESIFKPLQLKEQIDSRKEQARILAGQKSEAKEQRKLELDQKNEEKMQGLKTPFGLANTEDDAKKLKEAYESKSNFDSKLQEMIDLRKKHGGGTSLNREDVARAAQLSKDLLLEYKNMAKLGVLSQSDEKIINAIIPADPLAYNSPLAAIRGEDPILSNMEKFKADASKDFATKVATRTRDGVEGAAKPQRSIVKTQTNQKTGQKRIVYSDGSTEIVSNTAGR